MRKVLFLLGQLTDEDVEWIGRVGQRLRVPAGEALINEGQHVALLYILLSGRAEVAVAGVGKVASMEVGDIFGEMSFVDAMPPSATVRTETPSVVLAVEKTELTRHIEEDPTFGCRFLPCVGDLPLRSFTSSHASPATLRGVRTPEPPRRRGA